MRCQLTAVYGTKKCFSHGGGSPEKRGTYPGHGLVTGKHSKFQLNRLASNYIEAINDPELLSLRDPLAIVTMRIEELLQKIDAEQSVMRQEAVHKAFVEFKYDYKAGDELSAAKAFRKLDAAMEEMYDEYRAWNQMFKAIEARRKLSESEIKRLKEMNQFITKEQAYKLIAKLQAAVIEVLGDHPRLLKRLQFKLIKFTGDGDDDVLGRSGRSQVIDEPSNMDAAEILDTRTEFQDRGERSDNARIVSGSVSEGGTE